MLKREGRGRDNLRPFGCVRNPTRQKNGYSGGRERNGKAPPRGGASITVMRSRAAAIKGSSQGISDIRR
ncbi:hypothetical protein DESPIGER_1483 [Desulfovibrio piger]|uniref:Uncharacterized protein n=1 Tax=Desulfovibrio piger TaxID=901 RepID=A0A1K1LF49_9BACT|nr:hypothetical protein DESPIGER_1483 [Desulfovibrio piger]